MVTAGGLRTEMVVWPSLQIEAAMTSAATFLVSSSTTVLVVAAISFLLVMVCMEPIVDCLCGLCSCRPCRR
jgi:hypothetical protein